MPLTAQLRISIQITFDRLLGVERKMKNVEEILPDRLKLVVGDNGRSIKTKAPLSRLDELMCFVRFHLLGSRRYIVVMKDLHLLLLFSSIFGTVWHTLESCYIDRSSFRK